VAMSYQMTVSVGSATTSTSTTDTTTKQREKDGYQQPRKNWRCQQQRTEMTIWSNEADIFLRFS
jgi:hypothetical protein